MKRCALLILLLACSAAWCFSQKTVKVSATYTYYAPETMSVEEAKRVALERAKIQAIADEFGTVVSQSTSTVVTNENGKSDTRFFSTGGIDVKGEWIETIGEPTFETTYKEGQFIVTVTVKGKARPLPKTYISLIAKVLRNGTKLNCEADRFNNGDELYLYFKSPIDGSLLVYLIDYESKEAYCLLPYSSSGDASQRIIRDEEYIFFSENHSADKTIVDEYTLTCDNGREVVENKLVVIFSPNENLVKSNTIRTGAETPRLLSLEDFEKWRSKLLTKSPEIQIINKPISIKQK